MYHTNPTWRKILDFLNEQPYPVATFRVAKFCLYKEELPEGAMPTRKMVARTYGYLRRMADAWKIANPSPGIWGMYYPYSCRVKGRDVAPTSPPKRANHVQIFG